MSPWNVLGWMLVTALAVPVASVLVALVTVVAAGVRDTLRRG